MALIHYKPTTSSRRHLTLVDKRSLHRGKPERGLTFGVTRTGGRNHHGHITAPRRGSAAHRKVLRIVDVKRTEHWNQEAKVIRLEYDPNRTAFIALIEYADGVKNYIIATKDMKDGDVIMAGDEIIMKDGNTTHLKNIPLGFFVHNVELKIGKGGQMAKAAGSYLQILGHEGNHVLVRLKSGEQRLIHGNCMATIGIVSNLDHCNQHLSKAGRNRHRGIRPHVRGTAMNPIDHHLGGGNGKHKGHHPASANGQLAKGFKTRNSKRTNKWIKQRIN